jgi:uncharacterized protein
MQKNSTSLIKKTEKYVKERMSGEASGHDWFHVERVAKTALYIAEEENDVDLALVELAALLHDIGDYKVTSQVNSEEETLDKACQELGFSVALTQEIKDIILNLSFSKNIEKKQQLSLEGQIVQDADRLDALGAIGIARTFAYGGKKGRELYNPHKKPVLFTSMESYRTTPGPTINHFYEKLFLLKHLLNTPTARKIATKRERFMKKFLDEFYDEWEGIH